MRILLAFIALVLAEVRPCCAAYTISSNLTSYISTSPDTTSISSMVMTFKINTLGSVSQYLMGNGNGAAGNDGYFCYVDTSGGLFLVAGGFQTVGPITTLSTGTWYTIVMDRNSTAALLYCSNGTSGSTNSNINNPTVSMFMGAIFSGASTYSISMAEAGYFKRLLNPSERNALYVGLSPLMLGRIARYWPLVDTLNDYVGAAPMSVTGASLTVTTHPRVYK